MGILTTDSDADSRSREPMLSAGAVLAGRHRIEERIGAGGMAEVYRAFQPALSRHVAVKVMRSGSPRDTRRFTQEAQTLARLRHPNAVVAHDFGIHEDDAGRGRPFIVMELVRGETLRARIEREGSLSPELARHVAAEVASCVAAAHDAGIIHRDLKPTNIMLVDGKHPERPEVRVLDFGIAKLFYPHRVSLSGEGELVGSPRYMAPEQFDEDAELDRRVDIWTLGVMVLEMVSGRHPVGRREDFSRVLAWLKGGAYELPEDLPPDLARVVRACLQVDPDERPETMDAVVAMLATRRAGKSRLRYVVALAALAAVALGLVVFLRTGAPHQHAVELEPWMSLGEGDAPPAVVFVPRQDPFWRSTVPFLEAAAEGLGRRVSIYDARENPRRMVDQLGALLGTETLGGLVTQSYRGHGPRLLEMAAESSVPSVAINNRFEGELGGSTVAAIRPDDEASGRALLEHLLGAAARLETEPRVLALHGPAEDAAFDGRRAGFEVASAAVSVSASVEIAPSRSAARRATGDALREHPEINVIWAANDDMALGAVEGAIRAGRRPGTDLLVGGIDWLPEALAAIRAGRLEVSFGGHLLEPGLALVLLEGLDGGGARRAEIRTPMRAATKENVGRIEAAFEVGDFQTVDFRALVRAVREGRGEEALDPAAILRLAPAPERE